MSKFDKKIVVKIIVPYDPLSTTTGLKRTEIGRSEIRIRKKVARKKIGKIVFRCLYLRKKNFMTIVFSLRSPFRPPRAPKGPMSRNGLRNSLDGRNQP